LAVVPPFAVVPPLLDAPPLPVAPPAPVLPLPQGGLSQTHAPALHRGAEDGQGELQSPQALLLYFTSVQTLPQILRLVSQHAHVPLLQ
jgi:hypothetical protein